MKRLCARTALAVPGTAPLRAFEGNQLLKRERSPLLGERECVLGDRASRVGVNVPPVTQVPALPAGLHLVHTLRDVGDMRVMPFFPNR